MTPWRHVWWITAGSLFTVSVLAFQAATESSGLAFADSSRATIGALSCAAGDQGCCRNDADCDDGDGCTVDACVPTKGCTHAPVGLDVVRGNIERALGLQACAAEPVPRRITGLLARARVLIERVAIAPADIQAPLIESGAQPMPGPRNGSGSQLGNGEFFKWSDQATKLALYDNVFMAEKVAEGGADKMGIPGTLSGCTNNIMVWLGAGDYPAPLPDCFTVTKDRAVWETAVADWISRHPHVAR